MTRESIPSDLIEKFENETGKKAYWGDKITKSFLKWQKGEKTYNIHKERVAFYVNENKKRDWMDYAKSHNYSTLSKLIRNATDFFIENKNSEKLNLSEGKLDSNLSFYLKGRLTTIKAYVQLLLKQKKRVLDEDTINLLKIILDQCISFEKYILENIEKTKVEERKLMLEEDKSNYDILLVEDDYETISFLELYFKSLGYSCITKKFGREALNLIKQNPPSVVLLDIILPDMEGFDIIKEIRNDKDLKDLPVFFITAIPRSEALKKMEQFGANDVISKPFNLEDFDIIFEHIKKD